MGDPRGAAVGAAIGGGNSALAAALTSLGLPKDSVIRYEADLKANKFQRVNSRPPEKSSALERSSSAKMREVQVHTR
jgi:alkyl hydroperoxide reductase subunit AhpF